MDIERKIVELTLRGYTLEFSSRDGDYIHCWFEYDKYDEMSDNDWAIYDATFSTTKYGNIDSITKLAISKLENYLEIQRH